MNFSQRPTASVTYIDPTLDLAKVRLECQELVKNRAKISAGVATIPVPFLDVAVDSALLGKLLPEISERFGLVEKKSDTAHISSKDERFTALKNSLISFGGLIATRGIVKKTFQGFTGKFISKQVTKYIPLGGQIVAGTMSYMIFKKIAFDYIDECYHLAKSIQDNSK